MILVDANLLLYAKLSSFPEHPVVHEWFDAKLNGPDRVALPWESILALAALAIEHGLVLCSADGDFGRFKDLRWHNPLD